MQAKRWAALMANSQVKLDLLRTGTMAKKRNHDLAFLTSADPTQMDPELRTWYMTQRRLILSDISQAPAPSGTSYATTTDTTPTDTAGDTTTDTAADSPTSSASLAETPTDLDAETATPVVDLETAETATLSSAKGPTTTPIINGVSSA